MKTITRSLLFLALFLPFMSFAQHDLVTKVSGVWVGSLKIQGLELRIVFNISADEKDSLTITLDSPDQKVKGIATTGSTLTKDSIFISVQSISGGYRGGFAEDYTKLKGTWKQAGRSFDLDLTHQQDAFVLKRPQEPKPPFPYKEEEVKFENKKAGINLAGTLTMPKEGGPFPVAVLVTGSGPQNRNEELMGHKPFLVLADYLTRNGIAVLRYDDRGIASSDGDFKSATTFDFASDVSAAIDFLKTQKGIDTNHIGIIGHSEGGVIAPIVASQRKDVAFIVLMAGTGVSGERILLTQSKLIQMAEGGKEDQVDEAIAFSKRMYDVVKKYSDNDKAEKKVRALIDEYNKKHEKDKDYKKPEDAQINDQIKTLLSPWFRTFLSLDPVDYLSKVKCPVLALNGEKDLQVEPKENQAGMEKAFIFGGNSRTTLVLVPGVNHLFQTCTTGAPTEYGKIEETIAPGVLETIGKWVHTVVK
jgi:uncharacterized protein